MSSASENTTKKLHICCNCDRSFHSSHGLKQHQRSSQSRNNTPTVRESTETIEDSQFFTKASKSADEPSTQSVKYIWGKYKDHEFEKNLSQVYENVVFWRKNLFLLPSGKAGRKFVGEVSRLMSEWLHDLPLKNIGDAKFTTAKTLTEVKIKRSFVELGTKIGIVGVRRSYGTVKRN